MEYKGVGMDRKDVGEDEYHTLEDLEEYII